MTMNPAPQTRRLPFWFRIVLVTVPLIVIIVIGGAIPILRTLREGDKLYHTVVIHSSGLGKPTQNTLDPRFTDANTDLLADAPDDPARQIDPPTLVFSYIPPADETAQDVYRAVFAEFLAYMSQATGKPTEYQTFATLTDQMKAMREGKLHVAGFGTGAVPRAVAQCGFIPAWKLGSADGVASYRMILIVPSQSDIQSPADLKKRELTLTEQGSNSGFKAALVLLRSQFNLEPAMDYLIRCSGGHEESIRGIAEGRYEAAAVASDVLLRALARGTIRPGGYRVIYESEAFPTAGFGYVHNLKPELAGKIVQAFASFNWKSTGLENEFGQSNQAKFVPANFKDDWGLIRRIDNETGVKYGLDS
jgi:phosphonate transport system substrate-binding protein